MVHHRVDDDVRPLDLVREALRLVDAAPDDAHLHPAQLVRTRLVRVAGDAGDVVAVGREFVAGVVAGVAGPAGRENAHRMLLAIATGTWRGGASRLSRTDHTASPVSLVARRARTPGR